jgi:hypothetical protein
VILKLGETDQAEVGANVDHISPLLKTLKCVFETRGGLYQPALWRSKFFVIKGLPLASAQEIPTTQLTGRNYFESAREAMLRPCKLEGLLCPFQVGI